METILQSGEQMKPSALSKDLVYLSNKRVAMSAPGIKMDDIYYSAMNSSVELSECTFNNGRLQIALSSPNFGAQSQVIVPNQSLLAQTYLHLVLPPIPSTVGSTTNAINICRGWGWSMVRSITFLFGSSNVSQLVIPKHSILQTVMAECATAEQRSEIFQLGGQEYMSVNGGSSGQNITADLLLPFPWSSMCEHVKKPFDTSLLSNPISLQIEFDTAAAAFSATGTGIAQIPAAFITASLYFRQGDLSNKDQSLKYELMKHPDLMYSYPFIHHQPYITQFQGSAAPNPPKQINLLSFINADLVSISFACLEQKYDVGGGFQISPFNYDPISNVRLLFNGLVMYNSPGQMYKLYNTNSQPGASYFFNSVIQAQNSATPSLPFNTYVVEIDFARIRAVCFENNFQNVWRVGNNTLTLEVNTSTNNQYTLYATYNYNGIAECQAGETRIYFD